MLNKKLSKADLLWDEKVVDHREIGQSIRGLKARNPLVKIGFYAGDFDLLSPADCVFFQLCRSSCDLFVVGLQSDYSMRLNGKVSTFPTAERAFRMGSMVYVNYIVLYDEKDAALCTTVVDPDYLFYGRTQGDESRYEGVLDKEKLFHIEYPWREERVEGKFFDI